MPLASTEGATCCALTIDSLPDPSVAFWYHELEGEDGLHLISETFEGFLVASVKPSDD